MNSQKKRKRDASEQPSEEVGSFAKVQMDAKEFRIHLKETNNTLAYIKDYFLNNKDENNVANYISAGGSVSEIAESLTKIDLKHREQSTVIFRALHLVIVNYRSITDEMQFKEDCKQFIANYNGELQAILTSNCQAKFKKIVLKLLTSINIVGSLANHILSTLSLCKEDLDALAAHTDPTDGDSLRVCFIHFMLSFVIDQSPKVIEKLLTKRIWLPSIFTELKYDLPFTVKLVLLTLEDKIINNTNISKTSKLLVFNCQSLCRLSELYTWNPKDWYDSKSSNNYKGNFTENDLAEIRSSVHKLLLKITTSNKLGIVFQDSLYVTTKLRKNYTLYNFLQQFKLSFDDDLKKELLKEMILKSPNLIKPALNILSPQLNSNWIKYLTEVLSNVKIELDGQNAQVYGEVIRNIVIPQQILASIKSLNHLTTENVQERLNVTRFFLNILKNYEHIYNNVKLDKSEYAKFQSITSVYLMNHSNLPTGIELLDSLKLSYNNKQEDPINEVIKLFILYDKMCPKMIDNIRFDDTIPKWVAEQGGEITSEHDLYCFLNLLHLEIIINPQDPYQEEFLNKFKWTTIATVERNQKIGLDILTELFHRSGLFIRSPTEMALWIYCIKTNLHPDIGPLIASGLKWALGNTHDVYKILLESREEVLSEEATDLNLDYFIQLSDGDVSGLVDTKSYVLHLSPLLPSILHIFSEKGNSAINDDFLVAFIVHLFHRQVSIQSYISMLKKYSCAAVDRVLPFIEAWLEHPKVLKLDLFAGSVYAKVSRFILNEKSTNTLDLDVLLERQQAELLLEECLFISCELSRLGKATSNRLDKIVQVVGLCLDHEGIHVNLNHPTFLSDFYPLGNINNSDLSPLVISIAERSKLPSDLLNRFSHRLALEIKRAKKTIYNLEDKSKLSKLFKIFELSESDVEGLINHVFTMKSKYFERNSDLSLWALIATHLLSKAVDYRIIIQANIFINFINSFALLVQSSLNVSEMCSKLLDYLTKVYTDVSGHVLDSLKDLFYIVCTSIHWNEDLCVCLLKYLDKVDYSLIPLERSITLIASQDGFNKDHSDVLTNSAGIIYKGFSKHPSPKWVSDLLKIKSVLSIDTCKQICKKIKRHPTDIVISVESLLCIEMIFNKSTEVYTLYSLVMTWLNDTMNTSFVQIESETMCRILQRILDSGVDLNCINKTENSLIKNLLLQGLKLLSPPMVDLIRCFIKHNVSSLPPGEIIELLCSHSCFFDVLLNNSDTKYSTIDLMLELLLKDSTLITTDHVPILLSSYNASLSKIDKKILKIFQIYERIGGINLACWKPYVWGEAAIDHYSIRSKIGDLKPNPIITLELFNIETVQRTITRYPLNRDFDGGCHMDDDDEEIYDPAFYLPLLSQLVGEINAGWKVAGSGVIGLTIAALSSSHQRIRAAACHVLQRFYSGLANHKDNLIWGHFIEAIQGGMVNLGNIENIRLSSVVTTFLARASIIMASPDDPLYLTLHNFIYAKEDLKLNKIPAFLEMFNSTQNSSRHQQCWVVETLRDGIKEQTDLQLALDCLAFKFILDFYFCSLSYPKIKELIESLVAKCLKLDKKQILINNYSVIPWLSCAESQIIKDIPKSINPQFLPLIKCISTKFC